MDPATDMTPEERLARAHDLGISAFLGDTIYNFGELVRILGFRGTLLTLAVAHAPHPRRVKWDAARMAQTLAIHVQRGKHWKIRSSCTALPTGGILSPLYSPPLLMIT